MKQAQKLLKLELPKEDRLVDRDIVDMVTISTRRTGMRISIRLVDISPYGFHAHADHELQKGEVIRVILPLIGDVRCRVMWTLIGCFGCQFLEPIDERVYSRLLATMKTGRQEWLI